MSTVVIRADGSLEIGHGHIFRTLALAEELCGQGWKIIYVCRDLVGAPLDRIQGAGYCYVLLSADIDEGEDARMTVKVAGDNGAEWIVVDRYATDDQTHALWRQSGFKVMAIDDICEHPFFVDILLNQNIGSSELPYKTRIDTQKLLGPRYALLRRVYRDARPAHPKTIDRVSRVLVFMGGGDNKNATGKVLAALNELDEQLEIDVVLGSAYSHKELLDTLIEKSPHIVHVHRNLPDLAALMRSADMAIAAGGSVNWEMACIGVPTILVTIACNQEAIAGTLDAMGVAVKVGYVEDLDHFLLRWHLESILKQPSLLETMASKGFSLVDGAGAERIVDFLLGNGRQCTKRISVRKVEYTDAMMLWYWTNDNEVRANSFTKRPIPWNDHTKWLTEKLSSSNCMFLLALTEQALPIGQIRFEMDGEVAELNYSIASEARGKGYGVELIEAGLEYLKENSLIQLVDAYVKLGNLPSRKILTNVKFQRKKNAIRLGVECAYFSKKI